MLFNSIDFVLFFPTVFFLYWALPGQFRPLFVLGASCFFYMMFVPSYILILLYLIVLDYVMARFIDGAQGRTRRLYFLISILSTTAILVIFKYFNFLNENLAAIAHTLHWNYPLEVLALVLPLGLSFHTFQSLAYVIEVYKGRYPAERSFITYALYVMYFPQLVAGPIERPAHLLPQLKTVQIFDSVRAFAGLRRMLWGFFKKIVIGDNLGVLVDFVFAHSATADASTLLFGVVAFSIQLYADFSGYCDIAIGASHMLGIDLTENFRQPYFSRSVAEFWRRWHITLSYWFRDYIYIPLGGSHVRMARWCFNILVVFATSGLWHGDGWHFLYMGAIFGIFICFGKLTASWRDAVTDFLYVPENVRTIIQLCSTFVLVTIAWVFFRAQSVGQAIQIITDIMTKWGADAFAFLRCSDYCSFYYLGIGRKELLLLGLSTAVLFFVEYLTEKNILFRPWQYRTVRWGSYWILVLWILLNGSFLPQTFIYFQF